MANSAPTSSPSLQPRQAAALSMPELASLAPHGCAMDDCLEIGGHQRSFWVWKWKLNAAGVNLQGAVRGSIPPPGYGQGGRFTLANAFVPPSSDPAISSPTLPAPQTPLSPSVPLYLPRNPPPPAGRLLAPPFSFQSPLYPPDPPRPKQPPPPQSRGGPQSQRPGAVSGYSPGDAPSGDGAIVLPTPVTFIGGRRPPQSAESPPLTSAARSPGAESHPTQSAAQRLPRRSPRAFLRAAPAFEHAAAPTPNAPFPAPATAPAPLTLPPSLAPGPQPSAAAAASSAQRGSPTSSDSGMFTYTPLRRSPESACSPAATSSFQQAVCSACNGRLSISAHAPSRACGSFPTRLIGRMNWGLPEHCFTTLERSTSQVKTRAA